MKKTDLSLSAGAGHADRRAAGHGTGGGRADWP